MCIVEFTPVNKPFACPDCDKKFKTGGSLNVHRRIHTDEKLCICPDCDKKFTQSSHLIKHRRIHTGEKPFVCPDCDKTFTEIFPRISIISHKYTLHFENVIYQIFLLILY